jgi:hypothetical protein
MPSKRKVEARRRAAEKKAAKGRYAQKREKVASGWNNPRSPLRRLDDPAPSKP